MRSIMQYKPSTHTDGYVRHRDTHEPIAYVQCFEDSPVPGTDNHTTIERPTVHPLWIVFTTLGESAFRRQFPKAACPPARWCAEERTIKGKKVFVTMMEQIVGPYEWATWDQWDAVRFGAPPKGHGPKAPPRPQQPSPPAPPARRRPASPVTPSKVAHALPC
jgi:hypothetical protein